MSDTIKSLFLKFLLTFIASWIAFRLFSTNPLSWILTFAIIGTVVNYIAGDLLVLPGLGNAFATIGDAAMAILLAYILDLFSSTFDTTVISLIILGILIALSESFFHNYLRNHDRVSH